jgi:tetratricopeptide (TPR) repeat protein
MQWVERARSSGVFAAFLMGIFTVLVVGVLLRSVTHLRMHELRDSLQSINEKSNALRNANLLTRIAMINRSVLSGNSRENAGTYKKEAESALIAIRQSRSQGLKVPLLDRIALPLLNGFNLVLGLPRIRLSKSSEAELVLDLAYQFETLHEYVKASRSYTVYIDEYRLGDQEREFALLHRGFCSAMLSRFDDALSDFAKITAHSDSPSGQVARVLTEFLTSLKERIRQIESVTNPARRGELYYNASAYTKALENFALVPQNSQSADIRFLTARSLEETGKTVEALAIYRNLIQSAPASLYAVNANRRIYLLGTFLTGDSTLTQESRKNSESVVRDDEFMSSVSHLEKSAVKLHADMKKDRENQASDISHVTKLVTAEIAKPETGAAPVATQAEPVTPPQPVVKKPERPAAPTTPPVTKRAAPDLREEKIAAQAAGLAEQKKAQLLKKQADLIDKLTMTDGNIFYGVIYRESAETVYLYSVLGNLELQKSTITKREKVAGENAIKE